MSSPTFRTFFYPHRLITYLIACFALLAGGCHGGADRATDAALAKGMESLKMFDFNEAYKQLSIAQPAISRDAENWRDVTYAYALACWHKPPPRKDTTDQAVGLFNELLQTELDPEWQARVLLSLARIYEVNDYVGDVVELEKARELYREVIQANPDSPMAFEATLRLAQTYVQELDDDSIAKGMALVRAQIERNPDSPWCAVANQYLGDLYFQNNGDIANALKCYQAAEKLGFAKDSGAHFYLWRMSKWASELGQQEEAVRLWIRIVEEYPRSPNGTLARDYVRAYVEQHPESGITPPELQSW